MTRVVRIADLPTLTGARLGLSGWHSLNQTCVDQFAEATEDYQWIHCDPERAARGPFGAPIAHGLLTLSLLPAMVTEVLRVEDAHLIINKGLDRVRLLKPVRVGSRIRGDLTVLSARPRPRGFHEVVLSVVAGVEGESGNVLRADIILLYRETEAGEPAA